jgi:hypothetical protein
MIWVDSMSHSLSLHIIQQTGSWKEKLEIILLLFYLPTHAISSSFNSHSLETFFLYSWFFERFYKSCCPYKNENIYIV